MKNIKNILFIVLSIVLIITFTITITFINKIYGDDENYFLGYSGNMDLEDYILFVFEKKVYNISQSYEFINISSILLDSSYNTETITRTLSQGVYYIGYLNKDNNSTFLFFLFL